MTEFSEFDLLAMRRALVLAERGLNSTHPNPRVGCLLAREGVIIAEGWHTRAGEAHAEAAALQQAGAAAAGSTAYVTLEPCAHHGRTPPCHEALIAAGVREVVYAVADPDKRVNGAGAARLAAAGIAVRHGLCADEARELNAGFFSRMTRGRPFVRLKLAASLDGRTALANGLAKWITSDAARADVQQWRARSSAILTGVGTVLADDPALNVRLPDGPHRQPLRIVLDSRLRTPGNAKLLAGEGKAIIFTDRDALGEAVAPAAQAAMAQQGITLEWAKAADGRLDLADVLRQLAERHQVNELLVEAGATLAGALLAANLVDELLLYQAPMLLGQEARPLAVLPALQALTQAPRFALHEIAVVGGDLRLRLRPVAN